MPHVRRMRGPLPAGGTALRADGTLCQRGRMRYVIIGSGVAGIAAIESIRAEDPAGEVILIGDDPHGFYSRPGLAYYLTGELPDKALYPRTADDLRKLGFRYVRARVRDIGRAGRKLELETQPVLSYDRLLIAVGAQALP